MERKKTKHVNNAEIKNQKNNLKIKKKKKKGRRHFWMGVWGVETQKHRAANENLEADGKMK